MERGVTAVMNPALATWQTLSETIPGHAAILSRLVDLGDREALGTGQSHMVAVLAAMGTAGRMLQGEPLPPARLRQELHWMKATGGAMTARLRALGGPQAEAILQIGAVTTAAEERLLETLAGGA